MKIGYARVSTQDQRLIFQLEALHKGYGYVRDVRRFHPRPLYRKRDFTGMTQDYTLRFAGDSGRNR